VTVRFEQVLVQCRIERVVLEAWIAREWVLPAREDDGWLFSDADVARIEMIRDLTRELDLNEDAVEVVLPLIDQVYGLRASLRRIADAIGALPDPLRAQLRAELRKLPRGR
jgi:chaperone modulatory protein CbpM